MYTGCKVVSVSRYLSRGISNVGKYYKQKNPYGLTVKEVFQSGNAETNDKTIGEPLRAHKLGYKMKSMESLSYF